MSLPAERLTTVSCPLHVLQCLVFLSCFSCRQLIQKNPPKSPHSKFNCLARLGLSWAHMITKCQEPLLPCQRHIQMIPTLDSTPSCLWHLLEVDINQVCKKGYMTFTLLHLENIGYYDTPHKVLEESGTLSWNYISVHSSIAKFDEYHHFAILVVKWAYY